MALKKPQVEGRIAEVARFEVDHHQSGRPDEQILGAEVGVDER